MCCVCVSCVCVSYVCVLVMLLTCLESVSSDKVSISESALLHTTLAAMHLYISLPVVPTHCYSRLFIFSMVSGTYCVVQGIFPIRGHFSAHTQGKKHANSIT